MKLKHILHRSDAVPLRLEHWRGDELKRAGRFWTGKSMGGLRFEECLSALKKAFGDLAAARRGLAELPREQQQVLAIVALFGTAPGPVLSAELLARGLIDRPDPKKPDFYRRRDGDPVWKLVDQKLLSMQDGYYSRYWSMSDRSYPNLTLLPQLVKAVSPAPPLPWKPSAPSAQVKSGGHRSSALVALDLAHVAEALREISWQVVRGEMLTKGSLKRLQKQVGPLSAERGALALPDPEGLYYELLLQMQCLDTNSRTVKAAALEEILKKPAAEQARHWVRAWLDTDLWQDGIGVVPNRDNDYDPVRIHPSNLLRAKELLVWALCRIAVRGEHDWLDLETFLGDLWRGTRNDPIRFYWYSYSWDPDFELARKKESFPSGDERSFAFFLDCEGAWIANTLIVTLHGLGLVERGTTVAKPARPCFRLTDLGRFVFGAPEVEIPDPKGREPFLTVQPNHEILAYLDTADAAQVATLSRIAARTSAAAGQVQTFALSRDTVYRALESGLTLEAIRSFLVDQGRTPLPNTVALALAEWTKKRESLVLRQNVTVAVAPRGAILPKVDSSARALGESATLLAPMTRKQVTHKFDGWLVLDHGGPLPRTWTADERGLIHVDQGDSVSFVRLARIAERTPDGWRITEKSMAGARQKGMSAEQVLACLREHLIHGIPPLLETAIRNWMRRGSAFFGKLLLFRVVDPQACAALLTSGAFRPFVARYIPPDWFIIHDDKAAEARRLLRELGFALRDDCDFAAPVETVPLSEPNAKAREAPTIAARTVRKALRRRRAGG